MPLIPYRDRRSAGQVLAEKLRHHAGQPDLCVLALPRGGVPVAYEVASALGAMLDVFVVRRLSMPMQPEVAIGAIATGGVCVLNSDILQENGIHTTDIDEAVEKERVELERQQRIFRGARAPLEVRGRPVLLIDEGLASASIMRAAIAALRAQGPLSVGVAVPVGAREACEQVAAEAEEFFCPRTPDPFYAVGLSYDQFPELSDDEVRLFLEREEYERQAREDALFARGPS
jgi:putative phosphoribosyl transferase